MEENEVIKEEKVQQATNIQSEANIKKTSYTAGLIIGILSIVFGILFALVGDILGIIGIILNATKRKEFNTTPGLVLSIIGLVVALINNILGAILAVALFNS